MVKELLERNIAWARERTEADPGFFQRLKNQQTPQYFWIGCADSRVPANVIAGLDPGEVFVHRNVANLVHASDINCLSVLQFAVDVLKVKHVIVTGHYGCGGIRAAMDGARHGLIDHWLEPIREVAAQRKAELDVIADEEARLDRLCEMNVEAQVARVAATPIVQDAWARGQDLTIHGLLYGLADGRLRDLGCTRRRPGAVAP